MPLDASATPATPARGFTVCDVAKRYRVSPDKVRTWIRSGELFAINTAASLCGKPRFVITPEALERFERSRQTFTAPPPKVKRQKKPPGWVDFFPD
jgi:hypothetical protein